MITVELLDRVFQYDSNLQGAKDIISAITKAASESVMIIDCMDVDGTEVYSDYDKYIEKNINNIEHIFVSLITKEEFITGIFHTTYSYITGAIPKLTHIIDSLYTGENDAAIIDDLSDLVEGISWIYSVGREIVAEHGEDEYLTAILNMDYSGDIERLGEAFSELKNAIKNMDYILIADILNYEISDIFNKLKTTIQKSETKEDGVENKPKLQ